MTHQILLHAQVTRLWIKALEATSVDQLRLIAELLRDLYGAEGEKYDISVENLQKYRELNGVPKIKED